MNRDGIWPLVSAPRMRALDEYTIDEMGVSADVLMESAGRAVLDGILANCRSALSGPEAEVLVVCGQGNNGGDGLVVARHLAMLGQVVRAVLIGRPDSLSSACDRNCQRARAAGVEVVTGAADLPSRGVVVDAIFGTGLSREVKGQAADWVERINRRADSRVQVVAIDLPSGLHSETGQILGTAIRADLTVTVGCAKVALVLEPGRSLAGRIFVARVGIADKLPSDQGAGSGLELWSRGAASRRLPARPSAGHKGKFGHVLILGGSEGKTGAAALAARAALRAGAGLVTLGCPASLNPVLEAQCSETMTLPLPETTGAGLSSQGLEAILRLASERNALAIGPGMGTQEDTRKLVLGLIGEPTTPLVIDADGLNALRGELARLKDRSGSTVLTPHPGEAARLLETTASKINADRVGAARKLADLSGAVVVLKGAGTVIVDPGGCGVINPTGGAQLASAGTGDVLTGIVTALAGQGSPPFEAAALGVYLHGAASDRLAARRGRAGLLAGEIADELPICMEELRTEGGPGGVIPECIESTLLPFPDA